MNNVMVITDSALSSGILFIALAFANLLMYAWSVWRNWHEVSRRCFFWACAIALATAFFFLLYSGFREPVGGWLTEQTGKLTAGIK